VRNHADSHWGREARQVPLAGPVRINEQHLARSAKFIALRYYVALWK
jgi:hypothetical protein